MTFDIALFYLLGSFSLTAGTMVISAQNPIHSVLFLILVFCNVSSMLLLLEVEFIALIFIIVYVGAIAVLFLFVVMMLNVKLSELNESVLRYLPVGGLLAIVFLCEIGLVIGSDLIPTLIGYADVPLLNNLQCFCSSAAPWCSLVEEANNIQLFGNVIYTDYVYLFLLASMILLVSMIGAIVLTLHKRVNVCKQDIFKQVSTNFEAVVHNYS
jgi:NADH:ubiquinone oxidoreductase subunit 6 (subunit J)